MWFNERYTFSRGRSEVPTTFLRIRLCTCRRFAFFDVWVSIFQSSVVSRRSSANLPAETDNGTTVLGLDHQLDLTLRRLAEDGRPTTDDYFAPVLPTFFFKRSPA